MALGYNLISTRPADFPSIFGIVDETITPEQVGKLVYFGSNATDLYILKKQNQYVIGLPDSIAWITAQKTKWFIESLIFNGVEYVENDIVKANTPTSINQFKVTDFTVGTGTPKNNYDNWYKFLNSLFERFELPLSSLMYNDKTIIQASENDTLVLQFSQSTSNYGNPIKASIQFKYIFNELNSQLYTNNFLALDLNFNDAIAEDTTPYTPTFLGFVDTLCPNLGTLPDTMYLFDFQGNFYPEEGILPIITFGLETSKKAKINSLALKLLAFNAVTQENFELDRFNFDLSNSVVSNNIQEIEINQTRGFVLAENDFMNYVKLTKSALVGTLQTYILKCGVKFTWQDWIKVFDANSEFYNKNLPNNGLNKLSSNYSEIGYWGIVLGLSANVDGLNKINALGNTDYLWKSPPLKVNNYQISEVFESITIETFDYATMSNLNGSIRTDAYTLVRATAISKTPPITDISTYFGILRMQKSNGAFDIHELSTIKNIPLNNLLIPKENESHCTIELVDGKVVIEGLIDFEKLETGAGYNLSAYINDGLGAIVEYKLTEDGEQKLTEDGENKVIEEPLTEDYILTELSENISFEQDNEFLISE